MIAHRNWIQAFFIGFALVVLPYFILQSTDVFAQSEAERLQAQISESNSRLAEIQKQISKLEGQLQEVGAEKSTLQSAINKLELERKNIEANISYTQNKIGATDLQISKLTIEIGDTQSTIQKDEAAIAEMVRRLNESDQDPLMVTLLQHKKLSDFWDSIETLMQVRSAMSANIAQLSDSKNLLESQRGENTTKRGELVQLKDQYSSQNEILKSTKASKATLLAKTKGQEAAYQAQLAEQKAAAEKIAAQLRDYESQLSYILDPSSIPKAGAAVFNWPLTNIIITQYFGNTAFAKSGAYSGNGHNGMDFGVPVGTKIYAPLSGTVRATGNTDSVAGCYSYGKWTLIDHANGLSTLYAHQSTISVSPGQRVNTGDVIGYSGNTGYSTGPHLHFTVLVSDAVKVLKFSDFKSVTSCGAATTPVSALNAYLNPLDYLPKI
ncbi:peptidoglycan DD-metalloendopeptidase family protein [Candidatus Parcubacteria bacterium]|uniref:M23ase beta-sheet core domain-containing protein n=1 Tax=Candidatus Kaiserbacteria bacterium CG10_big_fil_rev_8_21_14_0_10_47_16 TaxID=1974608 RepID=A0A2H0UEF8_9BACT|nr:peptidoglycan DD-metalloendopeptidase family protein [Candidatus Parcubacteria bacterium]PIR84740.1 MAG: hypothetical protein COU16_00960 [Candidatus Kaiserbacteria bacterium CG10_big_fil_rev_8_21_14_0_10_47_16]